MCQQDSTGDHQYFSQPSEQLYKSGSEDTSKINSFLSVSIEKLNHVGQLSGLLDPFLAIVYCTVNSDDWLQERGIKTLCFPVCNGWLILLLLRHHKTAHILNERLYSAGFLSVKWLWLTVACNAHVTESWDAGVWHFPRWADRAGILVLAAFSSVWSKATGENRWKGRGRRERQGDREREKKKQKLQSYFESRGDLISGEKV